MAYTSRRRLLQLIAFVIYLYFFGFVLRGISWRSEDKDPERAVRPPPHPGHNLPVAPDAQPPIKSPDSKAGEPPIGDPPGAPKKRPLPAADPVRASAIMDNLADIIKDYKLPKNYGKDSKPKTGGTCQEYKDVARALREPILDILENNWMEVDTPGLTLVTHMKGSQVDYLLALLEVWEGPLSAALYVEVSEVTDVTEYLASKAAVQARDDLVIHIVLAQEDIYPENYVRNVALNYTRTKHVFLCDTHLVPSPGAYTELLSLTASTDANKEVFVIPAFETDDIFQDVQSLPQTKEELLEFWDNGAFTPVRISPPLETDPTLIDAWRDATEPYRISWQFPYDPQIVMLRRFTPTYSQKFAGGSYGRAQQILEVAARLLHFNVVPNVFLLHMSAVPIGKDDWIAHHFLQQIYSMKSMVEEMMPDVDHEHMIESLLRQVQSNERDEGRVWKNMLAKCSAFEMSLFADFVKVAYQFEFYEIGDEL